MTPRALLATATATTALIGALPATAQPVFDLGTITVTANAEEVELDRSGTTVEVVEAEELETQATGQIANYFTRLPGVIVVNNGGLGTSTSFRIRGLGGSYVPVLIDGIDMTDPSSTGGFSWGGLTGAGLGRVEILKGAQSARYGQGAVGGVVNIESWRPEVDGTSGQATMEHGSYNTRAASISAGYRDDRTALAFSASRVLSDGFSAHSNNDEDDAYRATRLNLSATHQLTDDFQIGFSALAVDSYVEYDDAYNPATAADHATDTEIRAGRVFAEFSTGAVEHTLSFATMETERWHQTGAPYHKGTRDKFAYQGQASLGMADLTFGLDHVEESDTTQLLRTNGVFLEAALAPRDDLDVVLSLRFDDHSKFGGMTSGRIAAAWRLNDDWIIRGQAGTSFKAPAPIHLGATFGNPDFQPEESLNIELGAERRLGGSDFIRATLFWNDFDNKIDWDGSSTDCNTPYGAGCYVGSSFTSKGIELSGQFALGATADLSLAYTFNDVEAQLSGALGRHARHVIAIGLDAELTDKLSGSVLVRHFGDVTPSAYDAGSKVGDYTLVGVTAAYDINDDWTATLRIENLLDEDYETAGGYNTAGRSAYFGLSARF